MWIQIQFVTSMPTALTFTAVTSAPVELDTREMVYSVMVRLPASLCEPIPLDMQSE